MLMIITRIEWGYLVEPVEHLHLKGVDVAMKDVERLDVVSHLDASHLDVDHQAPRGATALVEDTWQLLDMDLDVDHPAQDVDHPVLDADHPALDILDADHPVQDADHPALDILEEVPHLDVEAQET